MVIDYGPTLVAAIRSIHEARVTKTGHRLLHYTSEAALKSIIESECLWFGSLATMNDPMELMHGIKFIEEVLFDAAEGLELLAKEFVRLMLAELDELVDRYSSVFVLSLTGVEPKLLHWRLYGDDGRGVALEFDKEHLLKLSASHNDVSFFLTPLVYQVELLRDVVRRELQRSFAAPDFVEQLANASVAEKSRFARSSLHTLGVLPLVLKSPDYREESEWRLIACPTRVGRRNIGTHQSGGKEVEHLKVPLEYLVHRENPIDSPLLGTIHLGPVLTQERQDFGRRLRRLFDNTTWSRPLFEGSSISYRPKR